MSLSRLLAPALLLALTDCAQLVGLPQAATPVAPDVVTQSNEQNGRFVALVGLRRQHAEPFLGVPSTNFYTLRSWLDTRTGERLHQLYVEDSYFGEKRDYEAARDGDGQSLKFVPISNNEITCDNGSCSYAEEFAAALPEELLRAHPQGLTVAFTAKSGPELTLAVPGELIEKQLAAVDTARAALPAAAAAPPSTPLAGEVTPPSAAPLRP
jgi:hypothetical protein